MEKKLILLIIILIAGLIVRHYLPTPTGNLVIQPKLLDTSVAIDQSELKYCCEVQSENKTRGCWLLERYSCDYCQQYCNG
ncbi:MAG: hypothetical protein ABIG95_06420 [Candidatus Woesearchaeota archaeon]